MAKITHGTFMRSIDADWVQKRLHTAWHLEIAWSWAVDTMQRVLGTPTGDPRYNTQLTAASVALEVYLRAAFGQGLIPCWYTEQGAQVLAELSALPGAPDLRDYLPDQRHAQMRLQPGYTSVIPAAYYLRLEREERGGRGQRFLDALQDLDREARGYAAGELLREEWRLTRDGLGHVLLRLGASGTCNLTLLRDVGLVHVVAQGGLP